MENGMAWPLQMGNAYLLAWLDLIQHIFGLQEISKNSQTFLKTYLRLLEIIILLGAHHVLISNRLMELISFAQSVKGYGCF